MMKVTNMSLQKMQLGSDAVNSGINVEAMDYEWVALIALARDLSVSKDDIRQFLATKQNENEAATTSDW